MNIHQTINRKADLLRRGFHHDKLLHDCYDVPYKTRAKTRKPRLKSTLPAPVYEAHYFVPGKVTAHTTGRRKLRMSYFVQKGKPVTAERGRSVTALCAPSGARMFDGYVCYQSKRQRDDYFAPKPASITAKPKPARVTAKQARASLGHLLACLDGSITDHEEIRKVVTEARKIAA